MKAPRFWNRSKWHFLALALAPLGALYGHATARRLKQGAWESLDVPVICVGNINAGGTGKTPSVIALAGILAARGMAVHVVSRGYGGRELGPLRVEEMKHTAAQVGDEPLLMAAFCPTWVAKDRAEGAKAAIAAGAEVILLDDGFQNPALKKTLSFVVVDARIGFGNSRVLPAGPLREPVATGLARADAIISIGSQKDQESLAHKWPAIKSLPRFEAALVPLQTGMEWQGQRVLAFAGIGRPEKFYRTLAKAGAEIVATQSFADHAAYSDTVLQRLLKHARSLNAQLVTTEKDAVRLPASFRREVLSLPVRLEFADITALEALLESVGI